MLIPSPSLDTLLDQAWNRVTSSTGLSNNTESGVAYNLLKAFMIEIKNLWDQLVEIESQTVLSTASGPALDSIGNFFGVPRLQAQKATTLFGPPSVQFTNTNNMNISIPAGTRVWSSNNPDAVFFVKQTAFIPAGSSAFVDVEAPSQGAIYNVGAKVLDSHNVPAQGVQVTNLLPITNGQDVETDENYRFRIQQSIYQRQGANINDIRASLLAIPGVRDVTILNMARGAGTLDVLVYGYDPVVPNSVIDECQNVLDSKVAAGISAIAKAPGVVYVDVSVSARINFNADPNSVKAAISQAVHGYIDNLPIEDGSGNGSIIFSELSSRVQESSIAIVDSVVSMTIDNVPALRANQSLPIGDRFVTRSVAIGVDILNA